MRVFWASSIHTDALQGNQVLEIRSLHVTYYGFGSLMVLLALISLIIGVIVIRVLASVLVEMGRFQGKRVSMAFVTSDDDPYCCLLLSPLPLFSFLCPAYTLWLLLF